MSCHLGFDVGTKRIGVAVGNTLTNSAQPVAMIDVYEKAPDWPRIDTLIQQWKPESLVIGLPLALDGGNQPMTRHARRFAEQIHTRTTLPVHMQDERHTSQEAARRFALARAAGTRRRRDARQLDAMAAAVILENWLSQGEGLALQ